MNGNILEAGYDDLRERILRLRITLPGNYHGFLRKERLNLTDIRSMERYYVLYHMDEQIIGI